MKKQKLKTLLKIGILTFGIALLLQNCETNDENNTLPNIENSESLDLKTVSFKEAESFFDVKDKELKEKRKNLASKTNELPLEITPNWDSIEHEDLFGIDQAQLTLADANVNRNGKRITKLFFINLNDKIESVIFTLFPNQVDEDGKIIEASFFFVGLSGEFIDGYKIEEGKFARRYILNEKIVSKASFFMFLQEKECDPFWCDGGTGGQLGTVVVTANTGNSGTNGINLFGNGNYYVGSGGGPNSSGYHSNDVDLKSYGGANRITSVAGTIYTHAVRDKHLAEGEVEINELPPSCESFNYQKTSSNWQEASVLNIRFNIVVIEIVSGVRIKKVIPIIFPQPVRFGIPVRFSNGTTISSGLAAELSALAIEESIDDVVARYNNLVTNSTSVIRNHFKERLKHNLRERTNGGRVNFNDMTSGLTPTQYKTSAFFRDDCN